MNQFSKLPTLAYPLIFYNLLGFIAPAELERTLFSTVLISGSVFTFTVSHLFLISGIIFLTIEVIKSTRTSVVSIIDHTLSLIVFIVFLLEFVLMRFAGNATFLILTLMSLADVITGFTITLVASRRDVTIDNGNLPI